MLESLELNNRDPRGRELYVRHQQVYSLLELNVRLAQLRQIGSKGTDLDMAIADLSDLIADIVSRYEEAAAPNRKAPYYSDSQISRIETASRTLQSLCEDRVPVAKLMQAARSVVAAGSQPRFEPPRLVISNA